MIAINKTSLLGFFTILFSISVTAQEKGDIGFLYSSNDQAKIALEYRNPFADKWHTKIGGTFGSRWYSPFYSWGEIVSATDSSVVQRRRTSLTNHYGFRIGVERRMGRSMFSFGGDLNVAYRKYNESYSNTEQVKLPDGTWGSTSNYFSPYNDSTVAYISRHYVVPGLRVSFNMNVPLSSSFLLTLTASTSIGMPIHVADTNIKDPFGEFHSPNIIIDVRQNFGIGLRYNIGGIKKEKREKKAMEE